MALGEYVSVSSQRDSELAELGQEKHELADIPETELAELTALYEAKGLSAATARTVAAELSAHDALAAHLDAELHIDPDDLVSPVQAAARRHCRSPSAPCCRLLPRPRHAYRSLLLLSSSLLAWPVPSVPASAAAISAAPYGELLSAGSSGWPSLTESGIYSAPPFIN